MKFLKCVKKVVVFTCVLFTAMVFMFSALTAAMGMQNVEYQTDRLAVLLLFAFVAALASLIFEIKKLHIAVKTAINFVICYADMYVCVFLIFFRISRKNEFSDYTPAQILVASVFFIIAYAVVITIKLLADRAKKKKDTKLPYTKQFKELK